MNSELENHLGNCKLPVETICKAVLRKRHTFGMENKKKEAVLLAQHIASGCKTVDARWCVRLSARGIPENMWMGIDLLHDVVIALVAKMAFERRPSTVLRRRIARAGYKTANALRIALHEKWDWK